ncbi:MAG: hypothetical protein ACYDAE_25305 [Steroidobacteraceae bacterium]
MTIRRFKLTFEDDGSEFFCAAFESQGAREQALARHAEIQAAVEAPEQIGAEPRPRGRPSYESLIASAVEDLGARLDQRASLAERVRRVLRHLAETCEASEIPGTRTVERYLAEQPVRQKARQKSRQNSARAKLATTGG